MKISVAVLLLLLGSVLTSPVPGKRNEHLLYPYGEAAGDTANPKEDDGVSPKITLLKPFTFFNKKYSSAYVNNNGVISFLVPMPGYTPDGIPLKNGKAFITPYWADVNTALGGNVYYRQMQNLDAAAQIALDLKILFPDLPLILDWAMVATWDNVRFFGSASQQRNTFQTVLASSGQRSFVIMNYPDIQWTTGVASGGDRFTGLGGIPAQAGFNGGNDKNFYSIPGSRTPAIINITRTSNVGKPGRWVFEVGNFTVTGVAKDPLPKNEELAVTKRNLDNSEAPGPHEGHENVPATQVLEDEQHTNEVHQDNHDGTLVNEENEILPEKEQLPMQEKHEEDSEESEEDSDECK